MLAKVSQNEKSLDRSHRTVWSNPAGAPRGRWRRKCWWERGLRRVIGNDMTKLNSKKRPKLSHFGVFQIAAVNILHGGRD